MISRRQKAALHTAKRTLGLEDEDYRVILRQEAGVESSADPGLDGAGFERVMRRFRALGFRFRRNEVTPLESGGEGRATAPQLRLLAALAKGRGMGAKGLSSFLGRMGLPEHSAWLTKTQCVTAIEGIKKMNERDIKNAERVGDK